MQTKLTTTLLPALVCGLVLGQPALFQAAQAQTPATKAQTNQWQTFSPSEAGFSVLMPSQPKEQVQSMDTPAGAIKNYVYTATQQDGKVTYSVSYVDLPAGADQLPPPLLLEMVASGLISTDVKILKEQAVTLQEHPGRSFKLSTPNKTIVRHNAYLVKQRVYQVVAEIPAAQEVALSEEVEQFLNSFKLKS